MIDGILEVLLMIIIALPIVLIARYFYKRSDKYKQDIEEQEIKRKDDEENKNLEEFINLFEKENNKGEK